MTRFQETVLARRQAYREFAERMFAFPVQTSQTIRYLHEHFDLRSFPDAQRWAAQVGRLIGAASADDPFLAKYCAGGHQPDWPKRYRSGDLLTIPSYSAPGRCAGLWACGSTDSGPVWSFRQIDMSCVWQQHRSDRETGLAFLEACISFSPDYNNTAFIMSDPGMALTLHGAHFRDRHSVLPVALAYLGSAGAPNWVWRQPSQEKMGGNRGAVQS